MAKLELGMISSTWFGTEVGIEEGIRKAKEIGFDTYDIFEDPLDIDDADAQDDQGQRARRSACRSARWCCVAFGLVDFNPSVQRSRSTASRRTSTRAPTSAPATCCSSSASTTGTARSSRAEAIWDMAGATGQASPASTPPTKGLEIVLELEPFTEALLKDVDELVRFVKEVDHPAVRANADISHLHLSDASFEDVAELKGLIGHIHLSDCDGKVHGDMPAGHGRDADQGVPPGDRRHRLRGHGLDRARVRARGHRRSSRGRSGPTTARRRSCPSSASASPPARGPIHGPRTRGQGRDRHRAPPRAASATASRRACSRRAAASSPSTATRRACTPSSRGSAHGDAPATSATSRRTTSPARWWPRRRSAFGGVDVLVNNAGIYPSHAWDEYSVEEWDATLDANLRAMWLAGEGGRAR